MRGFLGQRAFLGENGTEVPHFRNEALGGKKKNKSHGVVIQEFQTTTSNDDQGEHTGGSKRFSTQWVRSELKSGTKTVHHYGGGGYGVV